jgi:aspartyl-tRNA(Asn)/glutamyl-tRNA(Gln) amidotransferase subunit C
MKKEDVQHLANLSRLELSDEDLESYTKDFTDILGFVDKLGEVTESDDSGRIESAGVRNAFREDGEPHETEKYTEKIIKEAPNAQDNFVKVKPILKND